MTSSHTGPSSGSAITWKWRNRQQRRSASIMAARSGNRPGLDLNRNRKPPATGSRASARAMRPGSNPSRPRRSSSGVSVQAMGRSEFTKFSVIKHSSMNSFWLERVRRLAQHRRHYVFAGEMSSARFRMHPSQMARRLTVTICST